MLFLKILCAYPSIKPPLHSFFLVNRKYSNFYRGIPSFSFYFYAKTKHQKNKFMFIVSFSKQIITFAPAKKSWDITLTKSIR